jgi:uncharacterized membrane protein
MAWVRWLAAALAGFEAGYMLVDGVRALTRGDYFTPSRGAYAGRLGPWAGLVRAVGIDPRSTAMKWVFVIYGVAWIGVAVAFVIGAPWAWVAMLVAAMASLWYLVIGTVVSGIVIVLLLLPGVRP